MSCVSDKDDGVAGLGVAARLRMHLGDERAGGVDRGQGPLPGLAAHGRRDPVGGEDDGRSLRHVRDRVDEDGAARAQVVDDVGVVDDLLADVDRASVERKGPLDGLDRPFDPCAVASRRGEEKARHHCGPR